MTAPAELFDQAYEAVRALPYIHSPHLIMDMGELGSLTLRFTARDVGFDDAGKKTLRSVSLTSNQADIEGRTHQITVNGVDEAIDGEIVPETWTRSYVDERPVRELESIPIPEQSLGVAVESFLLLIRDSARTRLEEIQV